MGRPVDTCHRYFPGEVVADKWEIVEELPRHRTRGGKLQRRVRARCVGCGGEIRTMPGHLRFPGFGASACACEEQRARRMSDAGLAPQEIAAALGCSQRKVSWLLGGRRRNSAQPKQMVRTANLPREMVALLDREAEERGISRSQMMRSIISEWLDRPDLEYG